jgi:hypothetical protein
LVKDEKGDLLANSHMLNRCKEFIQLLNVHREMEIRTAEPLVPEPSPSEVEIVLKS